MSNRKRIAAAGIVSLLSFALVACGSEDRTKADYLQEANLVCDEIGADRERIAGKHFTKGRPTVAQLQGFYSEFVPLLAAQVELFAALDPPDGDQNRQAVDAINDDFQREVDILERAASDRKLTGELLRTEEAQLHGEIDERRKGFGITSPGCV